MSTVSFRSCAVCEQIVGPNPDEWSAGRILPVSVEKSAVRAAAARSNYYHNAILDGYMSRNEVRELEGLQHKDGLDDMLYPLNSGVVGKENDENTQDNG